MTALLKVLRCTPRKRHGGFAYFGSTTYTLEGGQLRRQVGIGRHFVCACGEPFVDGDQLLGRTDVNVHANCAELVA